MILPRENHSVILPFDLAVRGQTSKILLRLFSKILFLISPWADCTTAHDRCARNNSFEGGFVVVLCAPSSRCRQPFPLPRSEEAIVVFYSAARVQAALWHHSTVTMATIYIVAWKSCPFPNRVHGSVNKNTSTEARWLSSAHFYYLVFTPVMHLWCVPCHGTHHWCMTGANMITQYLFMMTWYWLLPHEMSNTSWVTDSNHDRSKGLNITVYDYPNWTWEKKIFLKSVRGQTSKMFLRLFSKILFLISPWADCTTAHDRCARNNSFEGGFVVVLCAPSPRCRQPFPSPRSEEAIVVFYSGGRVQGAQCHHWCHCAACTMAFHWNNGYHLNRRMDKSCHGTHHWCMTAVNNQVTKCLRYDVDQCSTSYLKHLVLLISWVPNTCSWWLGIGYFSWNE